MSSICSLGTRFVVANAAAMALVALGLSAGAASGTGSSPRAQDGFGTIKGRLIWGGAKAPERTLIKVEKDPAVCGVKPLYNSELIVDPDTNGVANAIAYLPTPVGQNPGAEKALLAEHPKVEMDQKNCEFLPTTLALHQGQTIVFKSSDAVGHNVHYSGLAGGENFALGPNGTAEKKVKYDRRPYNLECDIHPWMKGNIMVFNHPFFAVTKPDGSFEIKGVPAGTQNLIVWHRKVGYTTTGGNKGMPVTVKPNETTDVGSIQLDPTKVK